MAAPAIGAPAHPDVVPGSYADLAEIEAFEALARAYLAGELDDDAFRPKRLHMGVYGIRQSTTHMVRTKVPGGILRPEHLDAVADVAERWSRGFAHLTTRQNFQVHFVRTEDLGAVLRRYAQAGMTTREACGNAVRNVTQSPLVGIDPAEVVDTRPVVDAVVRNLLRDPAFQDLPRKFKIAFDGSAHDHAHLGIHDVGVLAALDADGAPGFRVFVGGGLGSAPREADLLEPWTPPHRLIPTIRAVLEVFDAHGERRNRVRARMKFLLQRWGIERFREEVLARRDALEATGLLPELVVVPARHGAVADVTPPPATDAVPADAHAAYARWVATNVFAHPADGGPRYAATASLPLGDITADALRALAGTWRDLGDHVEVRASIRQNLLFTHLRADEVPRLFGVLHAHGLAHARAERAGDVVSCPGAETCNLAITASRGLADAVTDALDEAGLAEVEDVRINVSGCPNACGQHTTADIGFSGMARRDPKGNEAPGYRVYVGAAVGDGGVRFGHYVAKVPARKAPEAAVALLSRYAAERDRGERFADWVARVGAVALKSDLAPLDAMPALEDDPAYYVDWGLTKPFAVILGQGECVA